MLMRAIPGLVIASLAAFAQDTPVAPKPAAKPIYGNVVLGDGDAAVFALSAVREDPNGDPHQQEVDLRRQYSAQVAAAEAQSYALAARADAKVLLNPKAMD